MRRVQGEAHVGFERALGGREHDIDDRERSLCEAADDGAAVAKQPRREPVALREMREQRLALQLRQSGVVGKQIGNSLGRALIAVEQRAHLRGEIALPRQSRAQLRLGLRGRRIDQLEQPVILGRIQLQRRRGEEQQAPGLLREGAGHFVRALAAQVVRLVEDDQVPARLRGLRGLVFGAGQPF